MKRAFTLIELLVVISIIVVLLALLTPALDRVIYQAELVKCASNIRVMHGAITTYALGSNRAYPNRPHLRGTGQASVLKNAGAESHDDRVALESYFPLYLLGCPLTNQISYEIDETNPDAQVWAPYELWFGFNYAGRGGMNKIGQRLEAREVISSAVYDLDVFIADKDLTLGAYQQYIGTHQDLGRKMLPYIVQDGTYWLSWWYNAGGIRSEIDRNIGFQDSSVVRYAKQPWDQDESAMGSFSAAGEDWGSGWWRSFLPKR